MPQEAFSLLQYQTEGSDEWLTLCDQNGPILVPNTDKAIADSVFWASCHRARSARWVCFKREPKARFAKPAGMSRIQAATRQKESSNV